MLVDFLQMWREIAQYGKFYFILNGSTRFLRLTWSLNAWKITLKHFRWWPSIRSTILLSTSRSWASIVNFVIDVRTVQWPTLKSIFFSFWNCTRFSRIYLILSSFSLSFCFLYYIFVSWVSYLLSRTFSRYSFWKNPIFRSLWI